MIRIRGYWLALLISLPAVAPVVGAVTGLPGCAAAIKGVQACAPGALKTATDIKSAVDAGGPNWERDMMAAVDGLGDVTCLLGVLEDAGVLGAVDASRLERRQKTRAYARGVAAGRHAATHRVRL